MIDISASDEWYIRWGLNGAYDWMEMKTRWSHFPFLNAKDEGYSS